MSLVGRTHVPTWLGWAQLRRGGRLRFDLSETPPSYVWGTRRQNLPLSLCTAESSASVSWR